MTNIPYGYEWELDKFKLFVIHIGFVLVVAVLFLRYYGKLVLFGWDYFILLLT